MNYYQKTKAVKKVTHPQDVVSIATLQPVSQSDLQASTKDSCSGLRGRVFAWGDVSFLSKNIPSKSQTNSF